MIARAMRPRMRTVFTSAKTVPRSLFIHPRKAKLRIDSSSLPMSPSARNTAMSISENATILRTCSDAVMYCAIHAVTLPANCADAQIPTIRDIIEIACEMKPFLRPCIRAGIRHIKIMASMIFIYILKMIIFAD